MRSTIFVGSGQKSALYERNVTICYIKRRVTSHYLFCVVKKENNADVLTKGDQPIDKFSELFSKLFEADKDILQKSPLHCNRYLGSVDTS